LTERPQYTAGGVRKSRSAAPPPGTAAAGHLTLSIEGDLTLHGVTKPCVLPVRVTLAGGSLTAEGTTTVKQTDFGIQPVTAAGGSVRVKDELVFTLRAAR
jgi:polyisoprenoid-binding protein YceI